MGAPYGRTQDGSYRATWAVRIRLFMVLMVCSTTGAETVPVYKDGTPMWEPTSTALPYVALAIKWITCTFLYGGISACKRAKANVGKALVVLASEAGPRATTRWWTSNKSQGEAQGKGRTVAAPRPLGKDRGEGAAAGCVPTLVRHEKICTLVVGFALEGHVDRARSV